mmetsp:Transcript_115170/g.264470  ORF Transcript_115170/g.264470 Transcript_115170/m.264470 type:complete len:516 (-) Transcript_115170:183-1730(-)|eukprot:CAMPEP_0204342714 /NCGR_PEP_ID=MMETSP0469-20131031/24345_1 /ASSEMBLY_ACC=CAM_ASM_000384 /TAXON_ID=2969 /ORGANISM="Oxyrrhis marina" /LENGTH=515 /DNA_ID=CAMNT_0051327683 /DNA_START=27 /DNA_END=1574 /DNA_ORIENTATION=-
MTARAEAQRAEELRRLDDEAWLRAAEEFEMNEDFCVREALRGRVFRDYRETLEILKRESDGKATIMAIGDKILLDAMLRNLGAPVMEVLFARRQRVDLQSVENFVRRLRTEEDFSLVVKPTHLSNCQGVLIFDQRLWVSEGWTAQKLHKHMSDNLEKRALEAESAALQSCVPGIVVQKRYRSAAQFQTPLELRVQTMFGYARSGIWWWGRKETTQFAHRNVWVVRQPEEIGQLRDTDKWKVYAPDHMPGTNAGFDSALTVFQRDMPQMMRVAESVARAFGAPWLRVDLFCGNGQWKVRLNEVAYSSDVLYLAEAIPNDPSHVLRDDGPRVAKLLQEGFQRCQEVLPASHFLRMLGVRGDRYQEMTVTPMDPPLRPDLLQQEEEVEEAYDEVPFALCTSTARMPFDLGFRNAGRVTSGRVARPRGSLTVQRVQAGYAPRRVPQAAITVGPMGSVSRGGYNVMTRPVSSRTIGPPMAQPVSFMPRTVTAGPPPVLRRLGSVPQVTVGAPIFQQRRFI